LNAHSNSEASPITSHISRCHLFRFNISHNWCPKHFVFISVSDQPTDTSVCP